MEPRAETRGAAGADGALAVPLAALAARNAGAESAASEDDAAMRRLAAIHELRRLSA